MRFLIISDIHANLAAFEAVLADAKAEWDKIWFLGDLVGYGPDPNECVALLCEHEHISLSGNHDWAVLERLDLESFNGDARVAVTWTRSALTEESRAYLEQLPSNLICEHFTLAHASPRLPVWEYVIKPDIAATNFKYFETQYCLVGHTHLPIVFEQRSNGRATPYAPLYERVVPLPRTRLIINPGSVGQPRDHDPRAAYAILDVVNMTWEHRRVDYPIEVTQKKMRDIGMPHRLVDRIEHGW